ncbi:MAG TPA: HD domain-containing phosphohydrolase, partial [Chloroflexota bacterium]
TLLFPVPIAASIALVGTLAYYAYLQAQRRRVWQDAAFNAGRTILQVGVAGSLFHALAPGQGWSALMAAPSLTLAAALSALTYYLINAATVYVAMAVITGQNPFRLWLAAVHIEGTQHAALLLFGVVTAVVVSLFPVLGLAMVFPVCVVYYSLRSSATLRVHTQSAVEAIADAVDMRAFGTSGHSRRVADLAARVAVRLGFSQDEVELVRRAARVHDIGKVGFSDAVLRRQGVLDPAEDAALRMHPTYGAEILAPFAEYQRCRQFVRLHHERPDGSGYPDGRAGGQIPLGALIIGVAETFDYLITEGALGEAMSATQACKQLLAGSGSLWDARALQGLVDEIQARSPARQGGGTSEGVGARL